MVWWPFAPKSERADTLEVTDLHSGAPPLYSTRFVVSVVFAEWGIDSMKFVFGVLFLFCQLIGPIRPMLAAESKASWQSEWNQTVRAAEQEGQVMVSIGGYGAIIDSGVFQKTYPKIKITHITGAGTDLTQRISAERRAGKYLVDVYNGGGNSLFQVLYQGKMLDPIKSTLMLPEVTDATKWWEGKQKYADKEGQYIFVYEGNVSAGAGASYNSQLLDPREYKSYWDFLNPKLKGKILSTDIRKVRGAGIPWQFLYYNSDLGPKYLRRLFGEMDVTLTADLRQAVDWLSTGKFAVGMPIQGGTVYKAKNQGLPVDEFSPYHFKEGVNLSSAFGSLAFSIGLLIMGVALVVRGMLRQQGSFAGCPMALCSGSAVLALGPVYDLVRGRRKR